MRFSDQLIDHIRAFKRSIRIDLMNRVAVIENLKFLHDCCVASEQLLREAAQLSRQCCGHLEKYYSHHLLEEADEVSVLEGDLISAGVTSGWKRNPLAMGLIGTQYYLLKHVHPVSLLGYMAVEEADPTPIEMIARIEKEHGKELFRFLRMHAVRDLEHRKELIEVIDQRPEPEQAFITASAQNTLDYLAIAMGKIYG